MTKKIALLFLVMLMSLPAWAATTISSGKEEYLHANVRVPRRYRFERRRKNVYRESEPVLENKFVSMLFDKQKGHLLSLMDKKTGTELISNKKDAWPVISGLGYTQGNQNALWTDSNRASRFSYNLRYRANGKEFQGNWKFDWQSDGAVVIMNVYLLVDSSFSTWKIHVEMIENAKLERVSVPVLAGIGKLGDRADDDRLLVPAQSGTLFTNPSEKLEWWGQQYPSGYATMQFMAYYDAHTGFYISSLDERGLSKDLSWDRKDKKWAALAISYEGLSGTGNSRFFEAEATLGVFHGDWTTAASIYRDWAQQQTWAKSTIRNKGTPLWLTRIGISKEYYLESEKQRSLTDWVLKIYENRGFFSVPTLTGLCGWEHGGMWASGDYFPPQEGWEAFDKAIQQVLSSDAYPWLLIRAEAIKENSPAWRSVRGQRAAVRKYNGQPFVRQEGVQMCLESNKWLAYLKEVTSTLAQHGARLVQLDGFPICSLTICYNRNHKHGVVPGCGSRPYKVAENLQELRTELNTIYPDTALSGETSAELYLPLLDAFCHRDCWAEVSDPIFGSGLAQIIPLFHFVYHPNIVFEDTYNLGLWDFLGGSKYHHLAVGRCFIWGEICSYNMQDWLSEQGKQPVFELLKQCAKARVGFLKDFLVFGKMLPPPVIEAPLIYVESEAKKYQGKVPSVLSSAWLSEKNDVAIVVLNIGQQPLKTSLSLLPYKRYIHSRCKMEIYLNNDLIRTTIFDENNSEHAIELEPLGFTALIFRG